MKKKILKRPVAVVGAMALCLVASVSAMANTDVMEGFFRDITNLKDAIVGTSYEQADDEIALEVKVMEDVLVASVYMAEKAPFIYVEEISIGAYRIWDEEGNVVKEDCVGEFFEAIDGQAEIIIPLEDMDSGSYKMTVDSFIAKKKAEQDLTISGKWESEFVK